MSTKRHTGYPANIMARPGRRDQLPPVSPRAQRRAIEQEARRAARRARRRENGTGRTELEGS